MYYVVCVCGVEAKEEMRPLAQTQSFHSRQMTTPVQDKQLAMGQEELQACQTALYYNYILSSGSLNWNYVHTTGTLGSLRELRQRQVVLRRVEHRSRSTNASFHAPHELPKPATCSAQQQPIYKYKQCRLVALESMSWQQMPTPQKRSHSLSHRLFVAG